MARIYATSSEYVTYTGQAAPSGIDQLLAEASRFLESRAFRLCWYYADAGTGMPTSAVVLGAFRDAVCAQVKWWRDVGDSTGAAGVGWGSVEIGSVKLSRSVTAVSGDASPARQVAPQAMDALMNPDLTPDIFELGAVA
jgi:hypothetical protein